MTLVNVYLPMFLVSFRDKQAHFLRIRLNSIEFLINNSTVCLNSNWYMCKFISCLSFDGFSNISRYTTGRPEDIFQL